ncbi:MAG: serine/threonine-protein kinase [Woeseiaceae bacterium]|nr:serine/threonine-protein kinase [Woeseiaceae bacterium]
MTPGPDDDPLATGGGLSLFQSVSAEEDARFIGRNLGDYRIVDLIGQGGMSRVFRAERVDGSFERDVAIKVSATGSFNEQTRRQFALEQELLAGLNHPNISQLYDAHLTEEGWPYIVMELVEGLSVTEFVRQHDLPARKRVQLLVDIVDAVAYAHGRLVVHRDIKPSNVMVNTDGRPKLLDFGIARLTEGGATEATRAGAMTLRYASPEQLLGQPITVASDIYQLGLLIFEVLTGETVNGDETLTEAIQRAAHGRPVTLPDLAAARLPREIRLVVEQCLRPVADERYSDANALRNDLRAWLTNYPVAAAGQSAGYRFQKLIARNKPAAAIAAVAVLSLATGVSWYTWQLSIARTEASQQAVAARSEAEKAERVSQFLIDILEAPNPDKALGADVTVREVLDSGVEKVRRELTDDKDLQANLLYVVGNVYNELGEFDRSGELIEESVAIRRTMADEDPVSLGLALYEQSRFYRYQGDRERARKLLVEALTYADRSSDDQALAVQASIHNTLGIVLSELNEFEGATTHYDQAIAIRNELNGPRHVETSVPIANQGRLLAKLGRFEEALPAARICVRHCRRATGQESPVDTAESDQSRQGVYALRTVRRSGAPVEPGPANRQGGLR